MLLEITVRACVRTTLSACFYIHSRVAYRQPRCRMQALVIRHIIGERKTHRCTVQG